MGKSKIKKAEKKHDQISEVSSSQRPADQDPLRAEKDSDMESSKNSQHVPETESGSSHEGEGGPDETEGNDEGVGIDDQLEEAAARRNLSVLNVKSILHVSSYLESVVLSLASPCTVCIGLWVYPSAKGWSWVYQLPL